MGNALRQLDEEIAKARGWRRMRDVPRDELAELDYDRAYPETIATHWLSDELVMEAAPPPFSSSWALAGPLLEELWLGHGEDGPCLCSIGGGLGFLDGIEAGSEYDLRHLPPCETIARAWLAWHRAKR